MARTSPVYRGWDIRARVSVTEESIGEQTRRAVTEHDRSAHRLGAAGV
jgi:hypothetical protein